MEWLKSYVVNLCTAAVLGGLLTVLSPGERFEKPFKLIVSLFMLFVILSPFVDIENNLPDSFFKDFGKNSGVDKNSMEEKLWEETARVTEQALCSSAIRTVTNECGITPLSAEAKVVNKAESLELQSLKITIAKKYESRTDQVKNAVKKALGVNAEVILR